MKDLGLEPITYRVHAGDDTVRIEWRGQDAWAVVQMGRYVLLKSGGWEYEPMPSERTDEFIKNSRFSTPQEALEAYRKTGI